MDKYIIIPGCCDLNRGDQALGWETYRIAYDAGFLGDYSIMAEKTEPVKQSVEQGFDVIVPVLQHPTRVLKNKDNVKYGIRLKIILGLVVLFDLIYSLLLLMPLIKYLTRLLTFNKDKRNCLRHFKECNAVFMKGGGLIQSHGGLTATYATYYRLYSIFLAASYKKDIYIMPNSFGPFEGPFVKSMVKKAFRKCKIITSREEKTTEYVYNTLNISLETYPDLGFFLENGKIKKEEFALRYELPLNKKWVAITARPYRFPGTKEPKTKYENYIKSLAEFISWLYSNGYAVLLIEHTFATTTHENDRKALEDIAKKIEDKESFFFISDPDLNCHELKKVYSFCDYIVGTRFHSLIFSLSNNIPGIAISYDGNKSTGIMNDIGLSEYVFDIYSISSQDLIASFNRLIANEQNVKAKINDYMNYAFAKRNELIIKMRSKK